MQRNVIHESLDGDPMGPTIIRRKIPGPHGSGVIRSAPADGHRQCRPCKAVKPSNGSTARAAACGKSGFAKGSASNETLPCSRAPAAANRSPASQGRAQANCATPIVSDERNLAQIEPLDERRQILDVLGQPIGIILRLVAQSAADVIRGHNRNLGRNAVIRFRQWNDHVGLPWTTTTSAPPLRQIMLPHAASIEESRSKRIKRPPDFISHLPLAGHPGHG